jgi:hypothetical protein
LAFVDESNAIYAYDIAGNNYYIPRVSYPAPSNPVLLGAVNGSVYVVDEYTPGVVHKYDLISGLPPFTINESNAKLYFSPNVNVLTAVPIPTPTPAATPTPIPTPTALYISNTFSNTVSEYNVATGALVWRPLIKR